MLAEPVRIALKIGEVLDSLEVPWIVGGSVASSIHGIPRATQDIDLVADLRRMHVLALTRALETDFHIDSDAVLVAVLRRGSFNLIEFDSVTKVDIFMPRGDRLSAAQISRRQFVRVGDTEEQSLPVQSPEDVVLQKLRWFETGGRTSERQWRDVLGVLKVRGEAIDRAYMVQQAGDAGLLDLLQQATANLPVPRGEE